jgi:large subunit ribosomal protein L29
MARTQELADLDDGQLVTRLTEAKEELFNLRFQLVTGQLDNYARDGPGPQGGGPHHDAAAPA